MNTIQNQPAAVGRRRRRLHSAEFKANAAGLCMQPGLSMAGVANGVNANLLRRWVREAELHSGADRSDALAMSTAPLKAPVAAFVPM